jgi:hypothetical protein
MFPYILNLALSVASFQAPPANAACTLLTPAQVTTLIGVAKAMPMTSAASGSTCMFQNNSKILTVLVATVTTPDAAQGLFKSKKAVSGGADLAGWPAPAYAGSGPGAAIVGFLNQQTLTEVKLIDSAQKTNVATGPLEAVMKEVASRK